MERYEWEVRYTKVSRKGIRRLKEPVVSHVYAAIEKISSNPLPITEGGDGKPLGNKHGSNLTGLLNIKLRGGGVRVVYRLERHEHAMTIVIVSVRDNDAVYREAAKRI